MTSNNTLNCNLRKYGFMHFMFFDFYSDRKYDGKIICRNEMEFSFSFFKKIIIINVQKTYINYKRMNCKIYIFLSKIDNIDFTLEENHKNIFIMRNIWQHC